MRGEKHGNVRDLHLVQRDGDVDEGSPPFH
jgi:hypothetical protein